MLRDLKQIDLGNGQFRYEVRMASAPCEVGTRAGHLEQHRLLKMALETPDGLCCGPHPFRHMSMAHDGEKWLLYREATGD